MSERDQSRIVQRGRHLRRWRPAATTVDLPLCHRDMSRHLGNTASRPATPGNPHLETLPHVTRDMAVTSDLPALLDSIAQSLLEHTGAVMVRVLLYQSVDECDVCRALGRTGTGEKMLHVRSTAGPISFMFGNDH